MFYSSVNFKCLSDLDVSQKITLKKYSGIWKSLSPLSQNFLGFDLFISKQSFQNQWSVLSQHDSQCAKQYFNQNKENLTLEGIPTVGAIS